MQELIEALEWYGEMARKVRLIHSGGDAARSALSEDGGKRAIAALAAAKSQPADPLAITEAQNKALHAALLASFDMVQGPLYASPPRTAEQERADVAEEARAEHKEAST